MILNQSKVDREERSTSLEEEHPTSLPSQSHHDREKLRQELLGKVCFSSSVVQKPPAKPTKKKSSEEASAVVEGEGTNEVHLITVPQMQSHSVQVVRSIHSVERPSGDHINNNSHVV